MPDIDSHIFAMALTVFLSFGALNLSIELLISMVVLLKKLRATMQSNYSLESGKLEVQRQEHHDVAKLTASLLAQLQELKISDRIQLVSAVCHELSRDDGNITESEKAFLASRATELKQRLENNSRASSSGRPGSSH